MPREKHQIQVVEVDADQLHSGAGGPEYTDILSLNENENAGSLVSFIAEALSVTGGDATSKVNIMPLIMQNQEDDPSDGSVRSLIRCTTYQITGEGDTNIDAFTGATPSGKSHVRLMHNQYSQEIHGDYICFRVDNSGTGYTGGKIRISLQVKS
ncbi:MAG: hypothetical protein GTN64_08120 [Candidatus Latescibacteria bacterium]|nr:hypothetical protein [Candidatus Latescibacterota bacterium]NIO78568.1 hypothetical protein [Candidatus Latescibacterota bacterium]